MSSKPWFAIGCKLARQQRQQGSFGHLASLAASQKLGKLPLCPPRVKSELFGKCPPLWWRTSGFENFIMDCLVHMDQVRGKVTLEPRFYLSSFDPYN